MSAFNIEQFYSSDASFMGVKFWEQFSSGYAPIPPLKAKDAILEIPGSNNAYYQDFGRAATEYTASASLSVDDFNDMKLKHRLTGSLVIRAGTFTAVLRNITNPQLAAHDLGVVNCNLEFLIT